MKNKCTEPFPPTISVIAVAVSCGGDEEKPNPLYEYFSLFELSNSEFTQVGYVNIKSEIKGKVSISSTSTTPNLKLFSTRKTALIERSYNLFKTGEFKMKSD